jgi:hypothetical protein
MTILDRIFHTSAFPKKNGPCAENDLVCKAHRELRAVQGPKKRLLDAMEDVGPQPADSLRGARREVFGR